MTRQVNSLKRQAAKARRYQELKGELESQLRTVLSGRYVSLKAETEKASAALEAASAELKDLTVQAAGNDTERQKAQEVFYALEAQLTDARRQLSEMNVETERTKGRFEAQVREASNIEQRMTGAEQETSDLEGRPSSSNETENGTTLAGELSAEALSRRCRKFAPGLPYRKESGDATRFQAAVCAKRRRRSNRPARLFCGCSSRKRRPSGTQIAQADTYLAGIERDERTRVRKDEEAASS